VTGFDVDQILDLVILVACAVNLVILIAIWNRRR